MDELLAALGYIMFGHMAWRMWLRSLSSWRWWWAQLKKLEFLILHPIQFTMTQPISMAGFKPCSLSSTIPPIASIHPFCRTASKSTMRFLLGGASHLIQRFQRWFEYDLRAIPGMANQPPKETTTLNDWQCVLNWLQCNRRHQFFNWRHRIAMPLIWPPQIKAMHKKSTKRSV